MECLIKYCFGSLLHAPSTRSNPDTFKQTVEGVEEKSFVPLKSRFADVCEFVTRKPLNCWNCTKRSWIFLSKNGNFKREGWEPADKLLSRKLMFASKMNLSGKCNDDNLEHSFNSAFLFFLPSFFGYSKKFILLKGFSPISLISYHQSIDYWSHTANEFSCCLIVFQISCFSSSQSQGNFSIKTWYRCK